MALIKCPECGKEISDKATACINCGCPIDKNDGATKANQASSTCPKTVDVLSHGKPGFMSILEKTVSKFDRMQLKKCITKLSDTLRSDEEVFYAARAFADVGKSEGEIKFFDSERKLSNQQDFGVLAITDNRVVYCSSFFGTVKLSQISSSQIVDVDYKTAPIMLISKIRISGATLGITLQVKKKDFDGCFAAINKMRSRN